MKNCKMCNGSGKIPEIDLYGNPIIPQILENCIFCNGTGKEFPQIPIEKEKENQEYGNPLLDFTFDIRKNQNPFEL